MPHEAPIPRLRQHRAARSACRAAERHDARASAPPRRRSIAGPRKGVFGPFLPLLRSPQLLDRVAPWASTCASTACSMRAMRELVTCAAARHVRNQFEWLMHCAARPEGRGGAAALEALRVGARPASCAADEEVRAGLRHRAARTNGCSDPTYAAALRRSASRAWWN
jgi:4-carboxymuconolactone decarboxylase